MGNAKDLDVAMPMIEYSNNYSKTSIILWQIVEKKRNATITDSESFKFNTKITGKTSAAGNKRMLK